MFIRIFFLIIFIMINLIRAGDLERVPQPEPIFLQAIPIGAYHSLGFSNGLFVIPAEIADANPASLSHFQKLAAGLKMDYFTSVKYYDLITIKKAKIWLPTAVGVIYPFGKFNLGLAYNQKYALRLDSGDIPLTTPSNPEGTGETMRLIKDTFVHSFSGIASYEFPDLFGNGDLLSVGGQIFADYLTMDETIDRVKAKVRELDWSWKIGALYSWGHKWGVSVFYEKGIDITGEVESNARFFIERDTGSGNFASRSTSLMLNLPDKLSFSVLVKPIPRWTFSISPTLVYWNQIYDYYKNNWDISANTIYQHNEKLSFSVGYYNNNREYQEPPFIPSTDYNATFLGAGVRFAFRNLGLTMEVLDSHWFSAERRKQTMLKVSLNYRRE